jgi:hypothetical protein
MNDFVNPQHRGVNLPEGFKDMMDVLEAKKKRAPIQELGDTKPSGPTRIRRGSLAEIGKYVSVVLESKAESVLLGISTLKHGRVNFFLLRKKTGFTAPFNFTEENKAHEKIVREVFAGQGIAPILDSLDPKSKYRSINYSIPALLPTILEVIREVLRRAYGVAESDSLTFMLYERH